MCTPVLGNQGPTAPTQQAIPFMPIPISCQLSHIVLLQGAIVANYPWDGQIDPNKTYSASPDDATFRHLASVYANAHVDMHKSLEFPGGITNGAHWYPLSGGMQVDLPVCFASMLSKQECALFHWLVLRWQSHGYRNGQFPRIILGTA